MIWSPGTHCATRGREVSWRNSNPRVGGIAQREGGEIPIGGVKQWYGGFWSGDEEAQGGLISGW